MIDDIYAHGMVWRSADVGFILGGNITVLHICAELGQDKAVAAILQVRYAACVLLVCCVSLRVLRDR